MNEYDSEKMADVLRAAFGMEAPDDPAQADMILFNTCSVREKAQEKVFHDLGRVRHLKEKNPNLLIGVGGCVASQEGKAIVTRAPFVDVVFGPQTLHRLPQLIETRKATGRSQVDISFPEIEKFDHFLNRENFLIPMRPSQPDQIVNEGLRQIPHLLICQHRGCPMAFGETRFIRSQNHGQMGKLGHRKSHGGKERHLSRSIIDMIVSPNDMRNVHEPIIHHHSKIIGRIAI